MRTISRGCTGLKNDRVQGAKAMKHNGYARVSKLPVSGVDSSTPLRVDEPSGGA